MRLLLSLLAVCALNAQTSTFEAASVKPNQSGSGTSSSRQTEGLLQMQNTTLRKLILRAYGLPEDRDFVLAGPDWLATEHVDVVARFPGGTKPEEFRKMLQNLLAERFHLQCHFETRQMQAYALIPAKGGPRMRAVGGSGSDTNGRSGHLDASRVTMDRFAGLLSRYTGRMVVDETGLSGGFTFTLDWTPDSSAEATGATGPSLFTALQEQLGLKLEAKKAAAEVLVVDRMDRTPTEN